MASLGELSLKVSCGVLFVGDEINIFTVNGPICIDDVAGMMQQLLAEKKGWA